MSRGCLLCWASCNELRCLFDHGRDVIVVQVQAVDGSIGNAHSSLMDNKQRQLAMSRLELGIEHSTTLRTDNRRGQ